jgi:hypothetical protein
MMMYFHLQKALNSTKPCPSDRRRLFEGGKGFQACTADECTVFLKPTFTLEILVYTFAFFSKIHEMAAPCFLSDEHNLFSSGN